MRDDDRLLDVPAPEFGSGVIGVCDICGTRQAVIVLAKERYQLCVLDFLNKTWIKTDKKPGSPAPLYRSERVVFETTATPSRRAPAVVLSPTKVVRHPAVLIAPDIFGLTTTLLDAAIRFARDGFEVLLPDLTKTDGVATGPLVGARAAARLRGGVATDNRRVAELVRLYRDGLEHLLAREMVDATKAAVFGTGFGASVAVALAAESTRLAVVAVASPLPVRPRGLAKLVNVPVLCVVGERDAAARRAADQLGEEVAGPLLRVVRVPGARSSFLARDLGGYDLGRAEAAWTEIVTFLRGRLIPPPPNPPPPPARPVDPLAAASAAASAPPAARAPAA